MKNSILHRVFIFLYKFLIDMVGLPLQMRFLSISYIYIYFLIKASYFLVIKQSYKTSLSFSSSRMKKHENSGHFDSWYVTLHYENHLNI